VGVLALALGALTWTLQTGTTILAPVGMMLAVWVVGGACVDLWTRAGRGDLSDKLRRLRRLPGGDWGKAIAHAGMGITTIGIAGLMAWEVEDIRVAQEGERYTVEAYGPWQYDVRLNEVNRVQGPNYVSTMASIDVFRGDRLIAHLEPEKRVYPVAGMPTTEAAINNGILRDVYVVIGDPQEGGGWAVRTFVKPLANWIWAGCIVMALGGMVSLGDRRYRVAAGARKPQPPAGGVPAE
jgi:cytochrome c-type biogenesis protein CcmF